jgi:hypothetical protein
MMMMMMMMYVFDDGLDWIGCERSAVVSGEENPDAYILSVSRSIHPRQKQRRFCLWNFRADS